ncbi:MAG TPA: hypothetical protein VD735_00675, partial [Candidatus Saccharimonadales bacterium]|nr:hypothetical protein [Candidatus Saccharimonadales bacterium]
LQGGMRSVALPSPAAPTVQKMGTHSGAATYTYAVTATDGLGETLMSSTGSATSASATLSGSVYNRVSWSRVSGAISYKIYRTVTTGSYTAGLIGTVSAGTATMQFDDTGIAQSGAVPTANTTGGAYFAGGVTAANGMNIAYVAGNVFTIQGASSAFVTANATNGTFTVGDASVCSIGRLCIGQSVTGTGGAFTANTFNYMYVPSTITVGGSTNVGEDITIHDDSTASTGTRTANIGILVDHTNSTNSYSTYTGLRILNKATTSSTSFGGNAVEIYNGSTATFRATTTGAVLVQNTVNSNALFDVRNAAGNSVFKIDSSSGIISMGDPTTASQAAPKITIGDNNCGGGPCIWIGEADYETDSDTLQLFGDAGIAFGSDVGGVDRNYAFLESDGTFNISDNWQSQTKGYRFRTNGSGLDLQATGAGVTGELWLSGYSTADYSGTQVNFMRMMAYNRVVQVGDAADTSTPTLLAIAKKTDSANDPSGYEGAMYYNTQGGKMRCYQSGVWGDCMGIPKPNTRRSSYFGATSSAATFGAGTMATLAYPAPFAGYGDAISAMGNGGSSVTYSAPTDSGTPGMAVLTNAPTINSGAGVFGGNVTSANSNPNLQAYAAPGRATSVRMFVGWSSASTIIDQTDEDNPPLSYIGFRLINDSSGVSNWQCANSNGSTSPTLTTTSVVGNAGAGNRFEIIYESGVRIIFKINGTVVCTHTDASKFPASSTVMRTQIIATTSVATGMTVSIGWLYSETDY